MRSNWRFTALILGILFMSSCLGGIGDLLGCQAAEDGATQQAVERAGPVVD